MEAKFIRVSDFKYVNLAHVVSMDVDDAQDVNIAMVTLHLSNGRTSEVQAQYVPDFIDALDQFSVRNN